MHHVATRWWVTRRCALRFLSAVERSSEKQSSRREMRQRARTPLQGEIAIANKNRKQDTNISENENLSKYNQKHTKGTCTGTIERRGCLIDTRLRIKRLGHADQ